jgi:predicted GTPase
MNQPSNTTDVRAVIEENCRFLKSVLEQHQYLKVSTELATQVNKVVEEVENKLGSDTLKIALIGGFSAGKSTLINAMLGSSLLASRAAPTTICPTYVSYGDEPQLDILLDGIPRELPTTATDLDPNIELVAAGGRCPMKKISHEIYRGQYHFEEPGSYRFGIDTGEEVLFDQIHVPAGQLSAEFYYNVLTHQIGTSFDFCYIPEDRLPLVHIDTDIGMCKTITLRNWELDSKWRGVVTLAPHSTAVASLDFDLDWFFITYPFQYKHESVRPAKQSIMTRIRNFLTGKKRHNRSSGLVSTEDSVLMVDRTRGNVNRVIKFSNVDEHTKKFLLCFDVDSLKFSASVLPGLEPKTKSFVIKDEKAYPLAGQVIGALTSAGRADERSFAGSIHRVDLRFPAPVLRDLVIVDTPGISADPEHTEITMKVIRDEADACIFLCPADQAGTLTDLEFVRQRLLDISGAVIFLITKADKADSEDELEEIREFVSHKVSQITGIPKPQIYAVSAREALRGQSHGRQKFDMFLEELTDLTRSNQKTIMIRRLLGVQRSLIDRLSETASKMKEQYEQELKVLQSYVIQDLREFAVEQQPRIIEELDRQYTSEKYRSMYIEPLAEMRREFLEFANSTIEKAESESSLEAICKEELQDGLWSFSNRLSWTCERQSVKLNEMLVEVVKQVFGEFEDSFEKLYPLKRLGVKSISFGPALTGVLSKSVSTQQELAIISEDLSSQSGVATFGAGAGALVGSLIFPGVGTILGGIAGFIWASIRSSNVDALKQRVRVSIETRVNEHFEEELLPSIDVMLERRKHNMEQILFKAINEYLVQYESVVKGLIKEHEAEKLEMECFVSEATKMIQMLNKRSQMLQVLREGLRFNDPVPGIMLQ